MLNLFVRTVVERYYRSLMGVTVTTVLYVCIQSMLTSSRVTGGGFAEGL